MLHPPLTEFMSPDYTSGPEEISLFIAFVDNLKIARRKKMSQDTFFRELENHDMRFEFLKTPVILSSGANMTGIVHSISRPGMYSYIRDNFVTMVKTL